MVESYMGCDGRDARCAHMRSLPWRCLKGKGQNWVAICDPLKLTIQAPTWAELMEDIDNALEGIND